MRVLPNGKTEIVIGSDVRSTSSSATSSLAENIGG
jgi:hypothetical protein